MDAGCGIGASTAGPVAAALASATPLPCHSYDGEAVATTFLCLTEDMVAAVLLCLSARDIFVIARTCRRLRQSSKDDARLWQPLCARGWASKTACEKWIVPLVPQSPSLGASRGTLQQGSSGSSSSCSNTLGKGKTSAGSSLADIGGAASRRKACTDDNGPDLAPRSYRCRYGSEHAAVD